jgi:hypothetical protein
LRRFVRQVCPKGEREAFLRLDTVMGEEAQIDWTYVDQRLVDGDGHRSLWLFLMEGPSKPDGRTTTKT